MNKAPSLIVIGIGANLPSREFDSPRETCEAAVKALEQSGLVISRRSEWWKSAPVPASSQPWFINGVVAVETSLNSTDLLSLLLSIEKRFGRVRGAKNAARPLDLDLISYGEEVRGWEDETSGNLTIPHPRMNERGFVLFPLRDIAPDWRHPVLNLTVKEMIRALDPKQQTMRDE